MKFLHVMSFGFWVFCARLLLSRLAGLMTGRKNYKRLKSGHAVILGTLTALKFTSNMVIRT